MVFSQVLKGFVDSGCEVDLFTSNTEGLLSDIEGVNRKDLSYNWSPKKLTTLFYLLWSQLRLFFQILSYRNTPAVIYINTILPFGAALAGKLMGKEVIYHVHETSIKPEIFKSFLFGIAQRCASNAIYVSKFLLEQEPLKGVDCRVIYNGLSEDFVTKAELAEDRGIDKETVLMLCSLKVYKGVNEFVALAKSLPKRKFELVLNADQNAIDDFFKGQSLPNNLIVFPKQKNVHPFYERARLVLNLSHPDKWLETFGLTAIEAMAYGVPVIVPAAGGIAEVVEDKINGWHVDPREADFLTRVVASALENNLLYQRYSAQAKFRASQFSVANMFAKIHKLIFPEKRIPSIYRKESMVMSLLKD